MIYASDIKEGFTGDIIITLNGIRMFGNKIVIERGVGGAHSVWLFDAESDKLNATIPDRLSVVIPIEFFTEEAIKKIKTFKSTEEIEVQIKIVEMKE